MDDQGDEKRGLPPELQRILSPEYQREREERHRRMRERREKMEWRLERVGELLDSLKR